MTREKIPPALDRERVALVNEVVGTLPAPGSRPVFYRRLLDAVFHTLDVRRALLVERDATTGALRTLASRNEETSRKGDDVRVSRSILERSVVHGESVRFDDALADQRVAMSQSVVDLSIRSVLCVPIKVAGQPVGAIYADNRLREASFSEPDVAFLELLGRLAGIVFENLDHAERLEAQNRVLQSVLRDEIELVTVSPVMEPVLRKARLVAASDATVLLTGESGTGKEVLAEAIHRLSRRREGPFVPVNCAAIPENLLEAELFGFGPNSGVSGAPADGRAGKFERAHLGTLFLDEIGDMGISTQARILRAIESRQIERVGGANSIPVDLRILAATNQDLEAAVRAGRFRSDLYFRLRVVEIELPPLRDRPDDVLPLADHFLRRLGGGSVTLSPSACELLLKHRWPGNVRELRNAIERALVLCEGGRIEPAHLPFAPPDPASGHPGPRLGVPSLEDVEREHVALVLRLAKGNQTEAARLLGIARNTLLAKIHRFGLGRPDAQESGPPTQHL